MSFHWHIFTFMQSKTTLVKSLGHIKQHLVIYSLSLWITSIEAHTTDKFKDMFPVLVWSQVSSVRFAGQSLHSQRIETLMHCVSKWRSLYSSMNCCIALKHCLKSLWSFCSILIHHPHRSHDVRSFSRKHLHWMKANVTVWLNVDLIEGQFNQAAALELSLAVLAIYNQQLDYWLLMKQKYIQWHPLYCAIGWH